MPRSAGIIMMFLLCIFSGCGVLIAATSKYAVMGAALSVFSLVIILVIAYQMRRK